MRKTTIDPSSEQQVKDALAQYLQGRAAGFTGFAEDPAPVGRGFDTFIYAFRLRPHPGLDAAWHTRLVARIYATAERATTLRREALVQEFVVARGYPALLPLAVEDAAPALGLPLMLMEFAGPSAFDRIMRRPLSIRSVLQDIGELHARLHTLPVDSSAVPPLVFRDQLEAGREYVARVAPGQFRDELAWIEAHHPPATAEPPSLLHNDFHPLNVLIDDDRRMRVIDWSDAMSGDRHYDVGHTLALLWFAKIAATDRFERLALLLFRGFIRRRHISGYRRRLPLDPVRLHYWETYHTLRSCLQLVELRQTDEGHLTQMAKTLDTGLLDEAKRRLTALVARAPAAR